MYRKNVFKKKRRWRRRQEQRSSSATTSSGNSNSTSSSIAMAVPSPGAVLQRSPIILLNGKIQAYGTFKQKEYHVKWMMCKTHP